MSERTFKNWFSCVSLDKKYQDIVLKKHFVIFLKKLKKVLTSTNIFDKIVFADAVKRTANGIKKDSKNLDN